MTTTTRVSQLLNEFNSKNCTIFRRKSIQKLLRKLVYNLTAEEIKALNLHRIRVNTEPGHSEEIVVNDFPTKWVRKHHQLTGKNEL